MEEETTQTVEREIPRERQKNTLAIPASIIISAALIAGAIYLSGNNSPITGQPTTQNGVNNNQITKETEVAPISAKDHIRGNPNAPIVFVEYSDYDCPFCKLFHDTMNEAMSTYGAQGKIAWVYRQLPIVGLHPNAPKLAEASECVAELGGNDAFWKFTDLVFGERKLITTPSGGQTVEFTDMSRLPQYAATAGVDKNAFTTCLDSGKYKAAIDDAVTAGFAAGAEGTPHSIIMIGGEELPLSGYMPFADFKKNVDGLLAQLEKTAEVPTKAQ